MTWNMEQPAQLHEVIPIGVGRINIVKEPAQLTDQVFDLEVGSAHRPRGVGSTEHSSQHRVQLSVLGPLVGHHPFEQDPVDVPCHGQHLVGGRDPDRVSNRPDLLNLGGSTTCSLHDVASC